MRIQWNSDWQTSCFYHAWRYQLETGANRDTASAGRLSEVQKAIQHLLPELSAALKSAVNDESKAWRLLPPMAARFPGNQQFAEAIITRLAGRDALHGLRVSRLKNALQAVEAAAFRSAPKMAEQLVHRIGPIRQAWEAFGPGLLKQISCRTDPALFVESATALVVAPLAGGGEPYLEFNTILFEGVLAHPVSQLPETLRLAWMLSQLNNDLPIFSELIPGPRFLEVSKLALIPATLAAGAELGICRDDLATWRMAIELWLPTPFAPDIASLRAWWETYQESDADWRTALTGLDRLLLSAQPTEASG